MFLAINDVTIPVDLQAIRADVAEFGDKDRAADSTYLTRIDARKEDVTIPTRMMTEAEYATVYAALTAEPPLPATGLLVGAGYFCAIEIKGITTMTFATGVRRAIEFVMHQV
jgi:hypothetical protein